MGAQRRDIVLLVMRELAAVVGGGLLTGLAGSLAIMAIFQSLLFGVGPGNPVVIGSAATAFLVAALLAGGLPARRAAAVDSMVALRHE